MRNYRAILIAGALVAICSGGAIMWTNRYQIDQPFQSLLFKRYDRWTGRVEFCSSFYDNKTYCGEDLARRKDEGRRALYGYANEKFLSWGYSQDQINRWPQNVLDGARKMVANSGGSKAALDDWLNANHVK
jgi:hypothetical protein